MTDDRCPSCGALDSYRQAADTAWCRTCHAPLPLRPREVTR